MFTRQKTLLLKIIIAWLITSTISVGAAQKKSPLDFFNPNDLMSVGVYYYPEHWPKSQWERDLKNIADMGFEFTHFGEFAWAFLEPEEGRYDFTWLDEAVEIAHKNGLKVIMCTPTPAPPVWMAQNYPEILMENQDGRTVRHGTRQHISWSSEKYREFTKKIVMKLAKRYGKDDRIWGWQIDNEPSHYGLEYDYCPSAQKSFKNWLKKKYKTIDRLNKAWGTHFWSQVYSDFNQIRIPNEKELVQFTNPHAIVDFRRFNAEETASFIGFQYDILRKIISDRQWVTTNYQRFTYAIDPRLSSDLDFISYTSYPVARNSRGIGSEGFRISMPHFIGFGNDYFRPLTGVTALMELQIGQVCWGDISARLYPGTCRLFLYHAFAGGCSFVCSYRFRQPTFSYEQNVVGIVGTDGVTPTQGGKEYSEFIKEMNLLRDNIPKNQKFPVEYFKRKTAMFWSFENMWATEYQSFTNQWNYMSHNFGYYNALKSLGCPVDYIQETDDFSNYSVLIAPAHELIDKQLVEKWGNYVKGGGHLVLTCRTGAKNKEGHYWEAKRAEPIWDLIGAKIKFYDCLPSDVIGSVIFNNKEYQWNNYAEGLEANEGTEILAQFTDQFYAGTPVIVTRNLGSGTVTYIGVDTDDKDLEKEVLRNVFENANISVENYPDGLIVEWRDGFWVGMNYSSDTLQVEIPESAKILIGQNILNPTEVVVWTE